MAGLLILHVGTETFADLETDYTRRYTQFIRKTFTQRGQLVRHLAERMYLGAAAAINHAPRKL